jgi:hypothetical protein
MKKFFLLIILAFLTWWFFKQSGIDYGIGSSDGRQSAQKVENAVKELDRTTFQELRSLFNETSQKNLVVRIDVVREYLVRVPRRLSGLYTLEAQNLETDEGLILRLESGLEEIVGTQLLREEMRRSFRSEQEALAGQQEMYRAKKEDSQEMRQSYQMLVMKIDVQIEDLDNMVAEMDILEGVHEMESARIGELMEVQAHALRLFSEQERVRMLRETLLEMADDFTQNPDLKMDASL